MSALDKAAKLLGAIAISERGLGGRHKWKVEFHGFIAYSTFQSWTDHDLCGAILDALAEKGHGPYLGRLPDGWCAAALVAQQDSVHKESRGHDTRIAAVLALLELMP